MLIVDLSRALPGAFCGRLLALRGEDVVAVGPIAGGHAAGAEDWASAYLRSGVEVLDADADALPELVKRADAVLTGWDGGRPNHELDLHAVNPSTVEVVVGSFGTSGPYAGLKGSSLVDWAAGGYLYITGLPTREPLQGPEHLPAYLAGYAAACALEAGLRLREQGIDGPRLDVSTMAVLSSSHQTTMSNFAATGTVKQRQRHPQPLHPLDIIECADGWVSVAVVTDAQYDAFAGVIGDPQLVVDERFATGWTRHQHADEFDALVRDWFMARGADEIVDALQNHHVPAARMADPVTIVDDPQLGHRGYWQRWTGDARTGTMPGDPIRITSTTASTAPTQADVTSRSTARLPLAGTVVVDVTEVWAGPMATRILADLGATVIRVERPGARYHAHAAGPFVDWKMNRGKYGLAVDLKSEGGRGVVQDLAEQADVFVENFRPGVMERLGLGYDQVAGRNPGIVYVSLSGFGQDGPRASWSSFGPLLEAASSHQERTRYPDSPPLLLGHSVPDPVGGFAAAFTVLNRLRTRAVTGRGSSVDISQLEAYVAVCGEEILRASVEGAMDRQAPRVRRVFRCRGEDAWVAIDPVSEGDIAVVADALGTDASQEAIAAAIASRDKFEVAGLVQEIGVPAFAVLDAADLARDPHLFERGDMIDIEIDGSTGRMPTLPLRGQPQVAQVARTSPAAGEHSEYVLREILGYPRERVDDLLSSQQVIQSGHTPAMPKEATNDAVT